MQECDHAKGTLVSRLENPALRAEYSLTENVMSPFQAEPTHMKRHEVLRQRDALVEM